MTTVYGELEAAYREAARRVAGYHQWLLRHRSPLALPDTGAPPEEFPVPADSAESVDRFPPPRPRAESLS